MNERVSKAVIGFCQRLIQTPSLPGDEKGVAQLVQREMEKLGYDEVWVDRIGNVIGLIKGAHKSPSLMFTAHMDHVDPGDPALWPYSPYSGQIVGDYIYGRGASDTKGAIATQVYLPALLENKPHGDVYVAEVVLEEKGGAGTKYLVQDIKPDMVILGEPTANNLKIGHRGRLEIIVEAKGKATHASIPSKGINPHYIMAEFLLKLKNVPMESSNDFTSSAAPTLYYTDQTSSNVIPSKAIVHIDWRTVPGETERDVLTKLESIVSADMNISVFEEHLRSYTGVEIVMKKMRLPYFLNPTDALVQDLKHTIETTLQRSIKVTYWDFATDAGYFAEDGIPVVGFSPCEERYAHTYEDKVSIKLMNEALQCYPGIIQTLQSYSNI